MPHDPIPWADSPPPVPVARVWSPPPGTWQLLILGSFYGCWLHWTGKRSQPCLLDDCPAARHRQPVKWQAYAPAALYCVGACGDPYGYHWERVVLPIGVECAHDLRPWLGAYPGPRVTLTRGQKVKAWTWKFLSPGKFKVAPPECFDIRPTLYRLWGVRPPQAELPARGPEPDEDDQGGRDPAGKD